MTNCAKCNALNWNLNSEGVCGRCEREARVEKQEPRVQDSSIPLPEFEKVVSRERVWWIKQEDLLR